MQVSVRLGLAALFAALFVSPVATAERAERAAEKPGTVAKEAISPGKCLIRGTAIDANEVPLPARSVRLRNLNTSAIEQVSVTDQAGVFSFITTPEIPYIVEIIDQPGRIVAVGDVVIGRAGEVAGGFVMVPAAIPAYSNAFKSTAGAVLSALGGTGLTALAPEAPPLSPER
jgi:hypothetical protein